MIDSNIFWNLIQQILINAGRITLEINASLQHFNEEQKINLRKRGFMLKYQFLIQLLKILSWKVDTKKGTNREECMG